MTAMSELPECFSVELSDAAWCALRAGLRAAERERDALRVERDAWVKAVDRHVAERVYRVGRNWYFNPANVAYGTKELAEAAYRKAAGLEVPDV